MKLDFINSNFKRNILEGIGDIFGNSPNANDWEGWDDLDISMGGTAGSSVYYWIINDGDSVQNEAANILSYITKKENGLKNVIDSASSQYRNNNADDVMKKLYAKLEKGGYREQAAAIKKKLESKNDIKVDIKDGIKDDNKDDNKDDDNKSTLKKVLIYGGVAVSLVVLTLVIVKLVKKSKK